MNDDYCRTCDRFVNAYSNTQLEDAEARIAELEAQREHDVEQYGEAVLKVATELERVTGERDEARRHVESLQIELAMARREADTDE